MSAASDVISPPVLDLRYGSDIGVMLAGLATRAWVWADAVILAAAGGHGAER